MIVAQLSQEPLTIHEQRLLDGQVATHRKEGKIPRQLNIAMFCRSVWLYCKKNALVPPSVPADGWAAFVHDTNVSAALSVI